MRRAFVLAALMLGASAQARSIRLEWLHSGRPASSLRVQFDGGTAIVRSSANGTIEVPEGAKTIRVVDPKTKLRLVDDAAIGDAAILRVPEPIRVRGTAGSAKRPVRVRVGHGPRGAALTRFQREIGSLVEQRSTWSRIGVPLSASPLRWEAADVRGRRFTTRWMLADPPPVLAAFDADGGAATREVKVPANVRPRATVDAGAIVLAPPSILDVSVALPPGDATADLQLHVVGGAVSDRDDAAHDLAALDQRDRRLFATLALGDPYIVAKDGRARLRLPAWLSSVQVVLRESFGRGRIERQIALAPGNIARLDARYEDLGAMTAARAVGGLVSLAKTGGVAAGATVVLSDGPLRRETTTDAAGRFRFENVTAAPPLTFFVDARKSGPATHRRTSAFTITPGPDASLELPLVVPIGPPPQPLPAVGSFANCGVGDDQYPFVFFAQVPSATAKYEYGVDYTAPSIQILSDTAGTFGVHVYVTPFVLLTASFYVQAGVATAQPLAAPAPIVTNYLISVRNSQGFNLSQGTELQFSPPADVSGFLEATDLDLDANSSVTLPCVNIVQNALFISTTSGNGCSGELTLKDGGSCTIFLPADPTNACVCQ